MGSEIKTVAADNLSDNPRPSLFINAISNWASLSVNICVAFFLTPYLIRSLGKGDYGIWALLGSVVGMYGLLDLGVGSAVMRYVAYYLGRKDNSALNESFNSSLVLFSGIGLVCTALTFVLVRPLAVFFMVSEANFVNFQRSMWFLGLATALSFPGNVLRTAVLAHERFIPCNIVRIITELMRPCLFVTAIILGYGLQGITFAILIIALVSFVCHIVLFVLFCPSIIIKPQLTNWISTRQLLLFGLPAAVSILAAIFQLKLDNIVIARYLDMSLVTSYAVGAMLVNFLARFLISANSVLDPRFSQLVGTKDHEQVLKLYLRSLSLLTSLTFSVGVALILIGKPFILLWVGEGYDETYKVLVCLVVARMSHVSQYPTMSLLFALNRHRIYAVLTLLEGFANLGLSILFVKRWGIVGVAMGTMIPMVLCKFVVLPLYTGTQVDISARQIYLTIGRPVVLITALGGLGHYCFHPQSLSWVGTIGAFCILTLLFVATGSFLGQSKEYRYSLVEIGHRFIPFTRRDKLR